MNNQEGKVFLARRGPLARNEQNTWEFPGGGVKFGERLKEAVIREFLEEYDLLIEVTELLCVSDHILDNGKEHWVSTAFIGHYIAGTPKILEPKKCTAIGWFDLSALPKPLSLVTEDNLFQFGLGAELRRKL